MFDIKTDKVEFLNKWHKNLKENKVNSKLVANNSYTFITVLITNCLISCFLLNSIVYNGLLKNNFTFSKCFLTFF